MFSAGWTYQHRSGSQPQQRRGRVRGPERRL